MSRKIELICNWKNTFSYLLQKAFQRSDDSETQP